MGGSLGGPGEGPRVCLDHYFFDSSVFCTIFSHRAPLRVFKGSLPEKLLSTIGGLVCICYVLGAVYLGCLWNVLFSFSFTNCVSMLSI